MYLATHHLPHFIPQHAQFKCTDSDVITCIYNLQAVLTALVHEYVEYIYLTFSRSFAVICRETIVSHGRASRVTDTVLTVQLSKIFKDNS
jgi:hypothetical protein